MTTTYSRAAVSALVSLLLFASPVLAQTTAQAKSDAAAPAATDKKKPRTAVSLECSKEADAKGLHGKERKKFRAECKKAAEEKK